MLNARVGRSGIGDALGCEKLERTQRDEVEGEIKRKQDHLGSVQIRVHCWPEWSGGSG